MTSAAPTIQHERSALRALNLMGAANHKRARPCPSPEALDVAVGHLRIVAARTGETPDALLRRLGITGKIRESLMPDCRPCFRLNARQRSQAKLWGGYWRFEQIKHGGRNGST